MVSFEELKDGDVNLYRLLGVTSLSSEKTIRQAYRKLALQLHPDRNDGKTDEFRKVQVAYEFLCGEEKEAYDRWLNVRENGVVGVSKDVEMHIKRLEKQEKIAKKQRMSENKENGIDNLRNQTQKAILARESRFNVGKSVGLDELGAKTVEFRAVNGETRQDIEKVARDYGEISKISSLNGSYQVTYHSIESISNIVLSRSARDKFRWKFDSQLEANHFSVYDTLIGKSSRWSLHDYLDLSCVRLKQKFT